MFGAMSFHITTKAVISLLLIQILIFSSVCTELIDGVLL
jgi:hypothetical protein